MRYKFVSPDGRVEFVELPMSEAPAFGDKRVIDDVTFRRVPSSPIICGAQEGSTRFPRFESHQLPRWWKHHKGAFGPTGKPRFSNRGEVDESVARANDDDTEMRYGEL